ncbi:MAG TPA: hypothetical protein GXX14_02580 [Clostridiaceae bacterium]|nr:hypothetical protein [Clostridiaceae bacterium]
MRKILTVLLLICFAGVNLTFSCAAHAQTYETFIVKDNDKVIEFPEDFQPIKCWIEETGYYDYLIPLKPIVEYFGGIYSYDEATGNVTVINPKYDRKVVFPPETDTIIVNGIELKAVMNIVYTKRINGKVYIRYDQLSWIFYRKHARRNITDNGVEVILYDDPIIELDAFYNDYELVFEKGKRPHINGEVYGDGNRAVVPIKEMLEFMGYSVSLDMNKKVMKIRSDKGVIKIVFDEEYPKKFDTITYKLPKIYFNGKPYEDWIITLFNKGGTLYISINDLSFVLNDFIGKDNYYSAYWALIRGEVIWYDADYLKAKKEGNNTNFSDIKTSDWFYNNVTKLARDGLISGYPDKTFRPLGNITVAEFIKILIKAMGHDLRAVKGDYWAKNFINKAIELGIIYKDEFDNYDRPITRGEMARMILRAEGEEKTVENLEEYSSRISDYETLNPEERETSVKIFASGIITGFPDGSFGFHRNATRAEACAILSRFLNKEERIVPEL